MSIYLPDTNILIDALNSKRGRKQFLQDLLLQGHKLACCCITVAEVYRGMRPHEEQATDQFLSALIWYDITRGVARHAGRLRFEWAQRGVTLALADSLIAAKALEYGLILITNNQKHFPMPELSIYSLTEAS